MVDGTIVSRFIRLTLESFALRSAVQLQSESAPWLSSGFSTVSQRLERSFPPPPRFSDTLHAPKTIVRPFPRSDRIHRASNRYPPIDGLRGAHRIGTCRVAVPYTGALVFLFADIDGVTLRFSVRERWNRRDRERMAYVYTHSWKLSHE